MIPISDVSITHQEMNAVMQALRNGWVSGTGEPVKYFEYLLARRFLRSCCVATANATLALELALKAMGIGAGDEVIVPALTFVSPAAAVRNVGATPVFADIEPVSWTIDPFEVKKVITARTRAVIAVDVLGHPAHYDPLDTLCRQHSLWYIADCAEAHGAQYRGAEVGTYGDVSIFSFHANKAVSTGEGGCVLTDNYSLSEQMRVIANHGMTQKRPYYHEVVGSNYRMSSLVAAFGSAQVERWDELVNARQQIADIYNRHLPLSVGRRPQAAWATPSTWLYAITTSKRDQLVTYLRNQEIDARAIWTALPDLPIYGDSVRGSGAYPVARQVAAETLLLPTSFTMSIQSAVMIAETVGAFFDECA